MILIRNLQSLVRINQGKLKKKATRILSQLNLKKAIVSLVFCDNKFIKKINKKYFGKNSPTDVISFPLKDKFNPSYLGEVIISVEEALNNSRIYNTSFEYELTLYIVHGILHLLGYKDYTKREREIMEKKQKEILDSV